MRRPLPVAITGLGLCGLALILLHCGSSSSGRPGAFVSELPSVAPAPRVLRAPPAPLPPPVARAREDEYEPLPAASEVATLNAACASTPALREDGTAPPAPTHAPLGDDIDVPGDRPVYVLPGQPGDARVVVYLHGMCGDVTAADFFREAVRSQGTLLALRGDKACAGGRFKWRDGAAAIRRRIQRALTAVEARSGATLSLGDAILFGYSQGAERAERLAEQYPQEFPRVVLGGPPMRASPARLARAAAVAILGGELETTENMRAGAEALATAGIRSRFFLLECAYHGWYGNRADAQLAEVFAWLREP